MTIYLELPDDILTSARLSADEARLELAVALYAADRLSIGKARELARMSLWQFRQLLAARGIPVHLNVAELQADVQTLERLGRL